jgi:hypothetical protein
MAPLRGWRLRGTGVKSDVPHGHWNTTTFVAALRCDRIEAPWLLEAKSMARAFESMWTGCSCPTLRPGDIVIIEKLGSHKGKPRARSRGTLIMLSPVWRVAQRGCDRPPRRYYMVRVLCNIGVSGRFIEHITQCVGQASTSPVANTRPADWSWAKSGAQPQAFETTVGKPEAKASFATSPHVSWCDGKASTSLAAYAAGIWD